MKDFAKKVLLGLSVVADAMSNDPTRCGLAIPMIAIGRYDEELRCVAFSRQCKGRTPTIEDLNHPEILEEVNRVKAFFTRVLEEVIKLEAQMERTAQEALTLQAVRHELAQANKPHHLGTVAEIATRYNMSKSEVRRHKAAGTLDAHIEQLLAARDSPR